MIQPLRNYHRFIFEVLGLLLPLIFLAGLAVRPSGTKSVSAASLPAGQKIAETAGGWKNYSITTRLYAGSAVLLQLQPASNLNEPDLLLYWSTEPAPPASDVLKNATLLGAFEGNRLYRLPPDAKRGSLLLYSLAHQQLVDSAALDTRP
ncbi:MAG: hypothetical protein L0Z53_25365 [Acidobacteriales bacterium]|nr:hypothetical protein [Terriglobales bacterium]